MMERIKIPWIVLMLIAAFGCSSSEGSKIENGTGVEEKATQVSMKETATPMPSEEKKEEGKTEVKATRGGGDITWPKVEVNLPELPVDKNILPQVMILDEMLTDDARLEAVYKATYEELQKLEEKSEVSMSGTPEDIIKSVLVMVNAMKDFEQFVQPMANQGMEAFKSKYRDDADFSERYRTAYYAAEEEINGPTVVESEDDYIIKDRVKRSEVSTHFRNGYMTSRSSELSATQDAMEESEEIRQTMIGRVLSSANTDLMVADYKKGKDLADMLSSTKSMLRLVQELDNDNQEIINALSAVEEKKKNRMEEVLKAIEGYRLAETYDKADAPSDAASLENRMKSYLEKNDYDIRDISLASGWIAVHNVYGILMYYQIDFYVAAKYPESENGVLDVLYVTGKTGGVDKSSFATYSVGGVAQMLEANL